MKKLLMPLMLAGLILAFQPAHAARTVSGTILTGLGTVSQARCVYILGGEATNGLVGWGVPITPAEADGTHTISLITTTSGSQVWGYFYEDLGSCDGVDGPFGLTGVARPVTGSPSGESYLFGFDQHNEHTYAIPQNATVLIRPRRPAVPERCRRADRLLAQDQLADPHVCRGFRAPALALSMC